jgi:UDP-N-acetylmuramyl tripeptide synthase
MKIISLRTLCGPNYWSVKEHHLITLLVDLDILEKYPTNKICGFYTRLKWLMPSLDRYSCSKHPGGFLKSVKAGVTLASVIEHIARELQCLAGMHSGFGLTKETGKTGEYHVVFAYHNPAAGKYAAEAAVNITSAILREDSYDIDKDINHLKTLTDHRHIGHGTLFTPQIKPAIPIIAVTGTNGKTTTTCLLAHLCRQQGLITGYATTEGIYIQRDQIVEGECSGHDSVKILLQDSSVQVAVLECAGSGILQTGLAFQNCDIAVVTNIAEDHLGLEGIHTMEQLAEVKRVVPASLKQGGTAILNADDALVLNMQHKLKSTIALFSLDAGNLAIKKHYAAGGLAAVQSDGYIVILDGLKKIKVEKVKAIPITFNGNADFNIANVLATVLAAYVQKFSIESIRSSLLSFVPSPEMVPGRMNLFDIKDFRVLVDYAHNPYGLRALGRFIHSVRARKKIGVIAGVGDRRDEDLVAIGEEVAKIFDEIVIRMDDNLRGRSKEEIFQLMRAGIKAVSPEMRIRFIADENEAVKSALANAMPGDFIVVLIDKVSQAIPIIKAYQAEHSHREKALVKLPVQVAATSRKTVAI